MDKAGEVEEGAINNLKELDSYSFGSTSPQEKLIRALDFSIEKGKEYKRQKAKPKKPRLKVLALNRIQKYFQE